MLACRGRPRARAGRDSRGVGFPGRKAGGWARTAFEGARGFWGAKGGKRNGQWALLAERWGLRRHPRGRWGRNTVGKGERLRSGKRGWARRQVTERAQMKYKIGKKDKEFKEGTPVNSSRVLARCAPMPTGNQQKGRERSGKTAEAGTPKSFPESAGAPDRSSGSSWRAQEDTPQECRQADRSPLRTSAPTGSSDGR